MPAFWGAVSIIATWLAVQRGACGQLGDRRPRRRAASRDQGNTGHIWATHNAGAAWREITLPGNIQAMAASAHAVYAVAGDRLYRSPLAGTEGAGPLVVGVRSHDRQQAGGLG
ncbi:MAG TPA: hypothetical protein VMK84_00605 [Streptosporangiaceae bacterium]|nr:hypothetical protein [Streptosporangiaceae bacterium]